MKRPAQRTRKHASVGVRRRILPVIGADCSAPIASSICALLRKRRGMSRNVSEMDIDALGAANALTANANWIIRLARRARRRAIRAGYAAPQPPRRALAAANRTHERDAEPAHEAGAKPAKVTDARNRARAGAASGKACRQPRHSAGADGAARARASAAVWGRRNTRSGGRDPAALPSSFFDGRARLERVNTTT